MSILNESQNDRDKELAYLTHKSLEEIQKIKIATPDSIRVFDEKSEINPKEYINLYKRYKSLDLIAYLKTLMHTSVTKRHKELFQLLRKTRLKTCLDYGSGVGTHAIALAENNNRVTIYDVAGSELQHFATYRMLTRGLEFDVLVHTDDLPFDEYDLIICTDVLEHVANPVYELLKILSSLKTNGILHLQVSTMRKKSSGHFDSSIDKWLKEGIPFMEKYFKKEGQTIYRKI